MVVSIEKITFRAGNISPKYFKSEETPVDALGEQYIRSENALKDMAQEVLKQSIPIIDKIAVKSESAIQMYSKNTVLYSQVPNYAKAYAIAEEANLKCGIEGTKWLNEVQVLNDRGIEMQKECVEVQYLKIGK